MNVDSQLFANQPSHTYLLPKSGSKLAQVQNNLKQLFEKQQLGFGIPHKPIKVEELSPRKVKSQPQQQQPAPLQERKIPRAELTRKNMELFQQQQENLDSNALDGMVTGGDDNDCSPAPLHEKKHHHHHHRRNKAPDNSNCQDPEIAKLKETICTYDVNMNNLMQKLNAERESYRTATRELQRTNDILKNEVARIEGSFREMRLKREDEIKMNERLRQENDDLLNKNLRLQHDLAQALQSCQQTDGRCNEMRCSLEDKVSEKAHLQAQNLDMAKQLERMRNAMSVWTQNAEETEKSTGHAFTCALGKVLFCGSLIAVSLAALLQSAQASSDLIDCDYESESLDG